MQQSEVQSTTSLTSSVNNLEFIHSFGNSKIDLLFPLFDQILQHVAIPNIIIYAFSIYTYLQIMFIGFWPTDIFYAQDAPYKEECNIFMYHLGYIFWWLAKGSDFHQYLKTFIACIVITILSIAFTLAVCIQYYFTRKFIKWTLYPINFIFICLSQVILHPLACLIGSGIKLGIISSIKSYYALAFIACLMYGVNLFIYYIGLSFTSKTVYIRLSPISMWDFIPFFLYMILSSISITVLIFFSVYADYCSVIIKAFNAIAMIYIHIRTYSQLFHLIFFNSLTASMTLASIIVDIAMFALFFIKTSVFIFIPVVLFFGVVIVTFPFFYYTNIYRNNRIHGILSSEDDDPDFEELKLSNNVHKAEYYCRVGFMMRSKKFLDWSLIKHLHSNLPVTSYSMVQLISFFPSEWRILNQLHHTCSSFVKISYPNQFLLYQVNKLKTLRQYSNSKLALEKVSSIRMMSSQIENLIRSMWRSKTYTIRNFEDYSAKCNDMESIFEEVICDYPNNARLCEEYACFLAECRTNYVKTVKLCSRGMLIEEGRNFVKDNCFKLMVKAFPHYLKRKVLDTQGNFIKSTNVDKGSVNSSVKAQAFSSGSNQNSLVNTELEEQLGRQILTNGKQRIALDHAISHKQFGSYQFHKFFTIITFILNILIFIIIHFYFADIFIARKESTEGNLKAMELRFYCTLAIISAQIKFGDESGRNPPTTFLAGAKEVDGERPNYLDFDIPFNKTINKYVHNADLYLTSFNKLISSFNAKGIDTTIIARQITNRESKHYKCIDGKPIGYRRTNLLVSLNSFLVTTSELSIKDASTNDWYTSDDYCEASLNYATVMQDLLLLIRSLDQYQEKYRKDLSRNLLYLMIVITLVIFIWNCVPLTINIIIFCNQIKKIQNILVNLDKKVHENASNRVLKIGNTENDADPKANKEDNKPPNVLVTALIAFILGTGIAFLMFGIIHNADDVNVNIKNLNYWMNYVTLRLTNSAEAFHSAIDAVYLNDSLSLSFINRSTSIKNALASVEKTQLNSWNLITGTDDAPSIIGYDDEFDFINTQNYCNFQTGGDMKIHNLILCSSTSGAIDLFCEIVTEVVKEVDRYNGNLGHEIPQYMIHMGSLHLWSFLGVTITRIVDLVQITYDKMIKTSTTIMLCSFAISIVFMIVNISIMHFMKLSTDTVLTMIKRISPLDLINNKKLMNFLLDQTEEEGITTINLSHSILHQSSDGLLMASLNGTTESVNPAITNILGFKPEQLLGQNASSIFIVEDCKIVESQLIMMANKEGAAVYEDHLTCMNDSEVAVPCFVSILLMCERGTEIPHSFIILIRDESELIKMQKVAEESKEKSEKLLYQILPRDIVIKLNSGEKEIAFNVPSASIIFIDIQRFSYHCQSLTPSEIMIHLGTLFAAFDQMASKYPLITKIKLIGDDYMAASGLFMKDDERISKHAEQIIKFGLDCLTALDEVNVKMSSSLQVRIGVNSGGPLIAGVLGTDKPVFDIIGDPINVAARLQTTDLCGKIHISQTTYDLIQGMEFACEQRGEVYLKGKGKTMTYFVVPMNTFLLSSSRLSNATISLPHIVTA